MCHGSDDMKMPGKIVSGHLHARGIHVVKGIYIIVISINVQCTCMYSDHNLV